MRRRGKSFLRAYGEQVDSWFPALTDAAAGPGNLLPSHCEATAAARTAYASPAEHQQGLFPQLPTCCLVLRDIVVLPSDNSICATLPSWPAFTAFLGELELRTASKYRAAGQREDKPGTLTREFKCMFGGKPSYQVGLCEMGTSERPPIRYTTSFHVMLSTMLLP